MSGRRPLLLSVLAAVLCVCAVRISISAAQPTESSPASTITEAPITDDDREHWAFRPLARPEQPVVANASWCQNPIDKFILAALEREGLSPMPPADRTTLIRRVTLDLTGLPPKPEEIDAFLADQSAGGYERLIDRLLASPAYGERWAQHWLDLARFAETDGFEHDKLRPQAWRYRQWVIDAVNADMPYDEFVRLQIAGDELKPDDAAAAVATGFGLCGPDMADINSLDERRHMLLNDMTATVGSVFLALQLGCAQCHDHKYDPISQSDFYRLRAFFEPALQLEETKFGRTLLTDTKPRQSYLWIRGDFRRQGPEVQPAFVRIADYRSGPVTVTNEPRGQRTALAKWLTRADHPLTGRVIVNRLWQQHFGQGICDTPSDFGVMGGNPSHPELLDWLATELVEQSWSLKRMHKMMVLSSTYQQASHRQTTGWTAEQKAAADASWQKSTEADPHNRLLARMNRQRLDGEAIRDSMLSAADRLSGPVQGMGVMVPLPEELISTTVSANWKPSDNEEDYRRRSIYLLVRRNLRHPLLETFDGPDTNASCPRRNRSTTAPQALILLNSEYSLSAARDLAGYIFKNQSHDAGSDAEHIKAAYRRVLGRFPDEQEIAIAQEFVARETASLQQSAREAKDLALPSPMPDGLDRHRGAAFTQFCLALFNLNEFIYVD